MSLIDFRLANARNDEPKLPGLVARFCDWHARFVARVLAVDEAPADPTATFTSREWADLPTHHPATDE